MENVVNSCCIEISIQNKLQIFIIFSLFIPIIFFTPCHCILVYVVQLATEDFSVTLPVCEFQIPSEKCTNSDDKKRNMRNISPLSSKITKSFSICILIRCIMETISSFELSNTFLFVHCVRRCAKYFTNFLHPNIWFWL